SDWLSNPALYTVPQYVSDMVTLIARLRPATLAWVGTSMGGLIGLGLAGAAAYARMARASQPNGGEWPEDHDIRFERMVLNDVGPRLELAAQARIRQYVGQPGRLGPFDQAVDAEREVLATLGAAI